MSTGPSLFIFWDFTYLIFEDECKLHIIIFSKLSKAQLLFFFNVITVEEKFIISARFSIKSWTRWRLKQCRRRPFTPESLTR